jgi:hypothetical protein
MRRADAVRPTGQTTFPTCLVTRLNIDSCLAVD